MIRIRGKVIETKCGARSAAEKYRMRDAKEMFFRAAKKQRKKKKKKRKEKSRGHEQIRRELSSQGNTTRSIMGKLSGQTRK